MLKRFILIQILCLLWQTAYAVADVHGFDKGSERQHDRSLHQHLLLDGQRVDLSIEQTWQLSDFMLHALESPSEFDETSAMTDCQHCCHCHGQFSLAMPMKENGDRFAMYSVNRWHFGIFYHSLSYSPLQRPPITS